MRRQIKKKTIITCVVIIFTLYIFLFSSLQINFLNYRLNIARSNGALGISADPSDITPPTYSDLTISADPLELGDVEVFSIKAYDEAGINKVEIVLEGIKKNMKYIEGDIWQYDSWKPSSIGIYNFTIIVEDKNANINSTEGTVEVMDTTYPTYSDLTESADPLELGNTEVLSIKAFDEAGIMEVYIRFDDTGSYTMTNVGEDTWQYDSWTPIESGNLQYIIYLRDNNNNWKTIINSINIIDTIQPQCTDLTNNTAELELGDEKIFKVEATDLAGIKQVLIELGGINCSMSEIGGDMWQLSWCPLAVSNYTYTISIEDYNNNSVSLEGEFEVVDTTVPECIDLTNKSVKLELGDTQIISIEATDISGIQKAYIQLEEQWYLMTSINENKWQYDSWIPETIQIHNYVIYIQDNNNNWNNLEGSIEVIDITMPTYSILDNITKIELGNNFSVLLQTNDISGIKEVSIQFEGNLYLMNNIENDIWEYAFLNLNKAGTFEYTIIIEDNGKNILKLYRSFTVYSDGIENGNTVYEIPLTLILGLLGTIGAVSSIALSVVKVKKSKTNKKLKELSSKNPLKSKKSLILEREHLDLEANNAIKLGDYTKAAELFGKCKTISNQLFKDGIKEAGVKRSYYARLETEATNIDTTMAITTTCINDLMTEFGDEYGIWYYSEPQIYHHSPKMTDGLILNENEYFKKRVNALSHEEGLSSEISINLFNIEHVKAIQFIYTNDISTKNFLDIAVNYQTPDTMLFIVCLKWSKYQKDLILKLPQDNRIKYRENVCIITHDLFKQLVGLDLKYRKHFNKIIEFNLEMNAEGLEKIHNSNEVLIHDTNDLKDDLHKKGLIKKEFCDYFQTPVDIYGSEEYLIPIPEVGGKKGKKFPKDAATHVIPVICPNCKTQKKIRILDSIVSQAKQLTTISILKKLVCEHGFQFFVDKNFKVRGYQKVDVEVNAVSNNQIEIVNDSN